jgi:hypothetical protein
MKLFKNTKPLTVSIFPTKFKKTINKLSKKLKPLGTNNVNSGLTFYSLNNSDNGTIIIWRLEELKKVIIHEIFHAIYVDLGLILNEDVFSKYMKINFKLDKFIGVNESYVETIACVFNIIFNIIENRLPYTSIKKFIEIELYYCITKAAQILHYYNFSNLEELIVTNYKKFTQNSNVFSYYILKTLILYQFDKIVNILTSTKCVYNHLMINTNKECSSKYLHIIKNIYSSKIDNYIMTVIKHQDFINNSLRMTCTI